MLWALRDVQYARLLLPTADRSDGCSYSKLQHDFYARMVLKKCRVGALVESEEGWAEQEVRGRLCRSCRSSPATGLARPHLKHGSAHPATPGMGPGLQILKDSKLKKLEEMLSDVADAPRKKDAECSLHCRAVVCSHGHARAHSP